MSISNDPKGAAGALKTPLALIPPIAMEKIALVHKLGASKYGKKVPIYACNNGEELKEFCSCGYYIQNRCATQTDHTQHGDYALSVTTKDLACSETISKLLKKHSPTCDAHNLIVSDGEVERYGAYNWRHTRVCASTYVNAIMRHLNAWRDGEDLDPESGISHLAHIACGCNILLDADYCNTLQDDRNKIPDKKPYPSLTDFTCIKCGHVKVNHPIYGATCENCDYIGHDPY